MTKTDLADIYREYIACLNQQDWLKLEQFVHEEVTYNGQQFGISKYRQMLESNFADIPDLHFEFELLISDPPYIASRLSSTVLRRNCSSACMLMGERSPLPKTFSINSGKRRFGMYGPL